MSKAYVDSERCKACGLCMTYCKPGAIEMTDELNSRGYKHIRVKEEICVGCGACYTVCPDGVFTITEK
jgi:2-oxoglutarate ferredoxin oxidoreductase subunit delta